MKEIKLTLEGMTCSHCLRTVESALRKIGLTGKANLEKKKSFIKEKELRKNYLKSNRFSRRKGIFRVK